MFGCCPKTQAGVLADHLLLAVILNTVVGCTALHYTKLYSFRLSCKMVSFTAANTNRIFSVSKMGKSIRTLYAIQNTKWSKGSLKKMCNIFYIGGGRSGLVFVTLFFLQKHGLKWLNIAF